MQKQKDILNTQLNVGETLNYLSNSEETLITREPVKGSPFVTVKIDNKYFLALGDARITELFETKEQVYEYLKDNLWNIIGVYVLEIIRIQGINDWRPDYKEYKEKQEIINNTPQG